MIKILYYLRALNVGGAETFIYNVLDKIDISECHIDIVLQTTENKNNQLLGLCNAKGVRIFYTDTFEEHFIKSYRQLLSIVRENSYDAIHLHANSLINNIPILVSRKTKCLLVVHSHNSSNNVGGIIGKTIHYFHRWLMNKGNVTRLSCSDKAGKWMFGDKPYTIINNGINLDRFKYDAKSRKQLRLELRITDNTIVWGHVGRFVRAKNHTFLIKCFEEYNKTCPNSKLVLLGDGPLFDQVRNSTQNKNILFLGSISNTSKYYSLFDLMVFPSLFEGLPFVLVEAQAAGLPILASDNITKLVNVTGLIEYFDLDNCEKNWCLKVASMLEGNDRGYYYKIMINSIFDSETTIKQLYEFYRNKNTNK